MSNVNIRMDDDLKKDFEIFCNEIGLNMSSVFNLFARTVVREQKIPFEISLDPFYSKENMERLKKSISQMEINGGKIHDIIEVEDD